MIRFLLTCLALTLVLLSPSHALDASRFPIAPTVDANGRWTLTVPKGVHLASLASSNTHVFAEICGGQPWNVTRQILENGDKVWRFNCPIKKRKA